jgi:hypothetical protein
MFGTACVLINQTDCPIEIVQWPNHDDNQYRLAACRGTDWGNTPLSAGVTIAPGMRQTIGSIGDPSTTGANHWGWLYFDVVRADGSRVHLQAYTCDTNGGIGSAQLGYYDSTSTADQPMPSGTCGTATAVNTDHAAYYTVTQAVADAVPPRRTLPTPTGSNSKGIDFRAYVGDPAFEVFVAATGSTDTYYKSEPSRRGQLISQHYEINGTKGWFDLLVCEGSRRPSYQCAQINGVTGTCVQSTMDSILNTPSQVGPYYSISFGFRDASVGHDQVYAYVSKNHRSWMSSLMAQVPSLLSKPLSTFALPGAHDAGMFTDVSGALLAWIPGANALANIALPWVKMLVALSRTGGNIGRGILSVANTQKDTTTTQLDLGVRYFDFRPGYCVYDPSRSGSLYHQHLFIPGYPYVAFLTDVLRFLATNTREIVVVRIKYDGFLNPSAMTPTPSALDAALGAARNAVDDSTTIRVGDASALQSNVGDLLNTGTRLILIEGTWDFQDSYSDAAYATVDPPPILAALQQLRGLVAGTPHGAIYQLQATPTSLSNQFVEAWFTRSDASSILLSTKSLMDSATYPWVAENSFGNQGLVVFLNDFVDGVLTERAIAVTAARAVA